MSYSQGPHGLSDHGMCASGRGKMPLRCLDFAADHIEVSYSRGSVRFSASLRYRVAGEKTICAYATLPQEHHSLYNVRRLFRELGLNLPAQSAPRLLS